VNELGRKMAEVEPLGRCRLGQVTRDHGWPIWSWSLLRMRQITPISAMTKTKATAANAALTKIRSFRWYRAQILPWKTLADD
jgi:hypothetical protein